MTRAIFDDQEAPFRRLNGRGHGYSLGHDRDLPPAHSMYSPSRVSHLGNDENRHGDQVLENDTGARTRSRIPVAVRYWTYRTHDFDAN